MFMKKGVWEIAEYIYEGVIFVLKFQDKRLQVY